MKVRKDSWHCRLFTFISPDSERDWRETSFCDYWGKILTSPLMFLLFAILCVTVAPVGWMIDKIEDKFKGRSVCPFGKVEKQ